MISPAPEPSMTLHVTCITSYYTLLPKSNIKKIRQNGKIE